MTRSAGNGSALSTFVCETTETDSGESNADQCRRLIQERLRAFWRSEWKELSDEANIMREAAKTTGTDAKDEAEQAMIIEDTG